jgi:hypothetical protein
MVFVLYLAGLAVLIVVLALGLEFIQRRGAPVIVAPPPARQEPRVAPNTSGGSAVPAPPVAIAAPPPSGDTRWATATRSGAMRDIILIVAVGLLALIALGSDWVFYRQLEEMRSARRAWLAPQSARNERPPAVSRAFDVSVTSQNSGAEPAVDIFTDAAPFTVALAEAGSPMVDRNIRDALNRCLASKPGERTRVVYPNPAAATDRTMLSVKRELIDWDVLYGVKILVVPGCYAYRTAGQVHHSAFCFFYQHGFSNPNDWAICQGGNYAD